VHADAPHLGHCWRRRRERAIPPDRVIQVCVLSKLALSMTMPSVTVHVDDAIRHGPRAGSDVVVA
jgi:hypothetical protein